MTTDPAQLIGQVAALDENLRNRILKLAHASLDEAEFLMEHGDPRMKAGLVRSFMQVFSKYLDAKQADDEIESLKAAMAEVREAVMGRVPGQGGVVALDESEVATVDSPPVVGG